MRTAKSALEPAAISDVTAAMPSSDWPRRAPNSAWHSGTISEVVSASLVSPSSRHCQPSSDVDRSQPEAANALGFAGITQQRINRLISLDGQCIRQSKSAAGLNASPRRPTQHRYPFNQSPSPLMLQNVLPSRASVPRPAVRASHKADSHPQAFSQIPHKGLSWHQPYAMCCGH
jgi:hypothetical protein